MPEGSAGLLPAQAGRSCSCQTQEAAADEADSKKPKQGSVKQSFETSEKRQLDNTIGRFFYANGISFHAADSPGWHEVVKDLKKASTGYKSPGRESLRTTVLISVRKELDGKLRHAGILEAQDPTGAVEQELQRFGTALCSDGWTSTTRRPILNVITVTTKGAFFVKSIDTSGADKTATYQQQQLSTAIEEVGEGNVTAVFVDGGVPKSTRDGLEEEYPSLFVLLCAAHSIDLLLEDFYKKNAWVSETVDAVRLIVKFIRNHHKPLALFRDRSRLELLKPGDTRFGSNFIMLERALAVHSDLEELVASKEWKQWVKRQKKAEKKQTAATIKASVNNTTLWKQAAMLIKISKPFVIAMKMADGDVPAMGKMYKRIYDAIDQLKGISTAELSASRRDAMVQQAEERWLYFDHPLHRAAYTLDPEYQQCDWHNDPDVVKALEEVMERYYGGDTEAIAAAERQLEEFRTRKGRFGRDSCVLNMQKMSGWSWWAKYGGSVPELQRVAMDILSLVAGACSCERNWSAFEFIHSKKRNKLSAAKCEELVYIFTNLRLLRRATAADATEVFYEWKSVGSSDAEKDGQNDAQVRTQAEKELCNTSSDESMEVDSELDSDEIDCNDSDRN